MIELLSPVGDFECLKAAVQNGADAVYFGANLFSARAFASNFDDNILEEAINYAKIRGVKTNLTLNTLIKNNEVADAINLAKKAYEYGIDAIIVQDLGLACYLIKNFPGLHVHGSTQMSVHNLNGVHKLQELGFSRVVLSRELSIKEIEEICKNSDIEIEVFVHGALCISYSGQCIFSSMVGGRSGNRGKCAQPCRLPYQLIENNQANQKVIDNGYLLSPRDLCGLEFLPQLVNAGVSCLKIEGRMKTPEYVATVTRIYRKYLDLAISGQSFIIDEQDKKDLLQVFNRGGFSNGHLGNTPNRNLIYKEKPNNMGIELGKVSNFNNNKGHISFTTEDYLHVGDTISIENKKHETSLYTISELMIKDNNIKEAKPGDNIKIGRMKGSISVNDKIYKISDKKLTSSALDTLDKELRKIPLNCKLVVKHNSPISISLFGNNIETTIISDIIPVNAINNPLTKERLIEQFSKTTNTPFEISNFEIVLDDGLFIQSISSLNELRRQAISEYQQKLISSFKRNSIELSDFLENRFIKTTFNYNKKISLLLNVLNTNFDYSNLHGVDRIYIPLKYFRTEKYTDILNVITQNFDTYIYMPTIIRNNLSIENIVKNYDIKGFVLSNIGDFELLKNYSSKYKFICNYTFNIYNDLTINELNVDTVTLSPELNKLDLQNIYANNTELIVYGNTPIMNSNYCLLGKSNKCYPECKKLCNSSNKYFLKDRLGFLFRIIPDNHETITTIYNSKITSIPHKEVNVDSVRIDILDENISEINDIIRIVRTGEKLEGKNYTNGNFSRNV